jgi:hypothetical protein
MEYWSIGVVEYWSGGNLLASPPMEQHQGVCPRNGSSGSETRPITSAILHYSNTPLLQYSITPLCPYPFVAPAVSPPRQYLPNATNAISKGKTLTNEPIAIKL